MAATPIEITRDIVIALIGRSSGYLGSGTNDQVAKQVSDVFEAIHKTVLERHSAE